MSRYYDFAIIPSKLKISCNFWEEEKIDNFFLTKIFVC
uniref:Uncharacterized protein n=1 Tax=Rhizophora mucronata TaxID=61149 RepID=A0A2P2IMX9_RHIMU